MVLERIDSESQISDVQHLVTVEVGALAQLIQHVYSAGLLIATPHQSEAADDHREAVVEHLDAVVRSIQSMIFRSRTAPADRISLVLWVATAAREIAREAETMNDGAGFLLREASQSLHLALIALREANDYTML